MHARSVASILILLVSVSSAWATTEVTFLGGRTLVVQSLETRNGRTTLTLPGGGTITLEAARIQSAVELIDPPAIAEVVPPPEEDRPTGDPQGPAAPAASATSAAVPVPARTPDYARLIEGAARRRDVDPELLRCLIVVESGLDPNAVSPKGARGLAQLMPATAREMQVADPFDPVQAVDAAARRLHDLLERSGGRFVPALAAYNAGSGAVARYGGVPPYRETIAYVERILTLYAAN